MAVHFAVTGHDIGSRDGVAKRDGGLIARSRGPRAHFGSRGCPPTEERDLKNTRNVIHESALEIYRTRMWDRVGRARGSVRNVIRRSGRKMSGAQQNKSEKQKSRAEMKDNNSRQVNRI